MGGWWKAGTRGFVCSSVKLRTGQAQLCFYSSGRRSDNLNPKSRVPLCMWDAPRQSGFKNLYLGNGKIT